MTTNEIIRSQYLATLEMLYQAILQCPQDLWADGKPDNQFWQVAYHALFYTHLYLQPSEQDFTPWKIHFENAHRFNQPGEEQNVRSYQKEELLEYLEFCRQEVNHQVPELDLETESGFDWIPFNKHELQYYNIRHLQHHTGELCERLGTLAGIDIDWIGTIPTGQS